MNNSEPEFQWNEIHNRNAISHAYPELALAHDKDITIIALSPLKNENGEPRKPTTSERRDLEELYGAHLIFDGFDNATRNIPGLVIHLVENRSGIKAYRGDVNLFDGRSKIYREMCDNKWAEYPLA